MLSACSSLPLSGPSANDILSGATTRARTTRKDVAAFRYAFVDINARVVHYAPSSTSGSLYKSFGKNAEPAPEVLVGVGDVIQVTIFESKSGGLFVPADSGSRPGNFVQFPAQIVDRSGNIAVPYAGKVGAKGKSLIDLQNEIESKLAKRALEPQVIVSMTEQNSSMVSVVGEVRTPTKLRIRRNGERILDMIAQSGGTTHPGYDSYVTLHRGKRKVTVYFNTLVNKPRENIFVSPGDTIYVSHKPRRFAVFGAHAASGTGTSNQYNFDQENMTLVEGVAKAGGLLDDRADPKRVFLYRAEPRNVLRRMRVDLRRFPRRQKLIPTIYHANLRDPAGYFFAQRFPMKLNDVVYISNADSVRVTKFLSFLGGSASNLDEVRNLIRSNASAR
jgi:polysaccharide export outer membrane protein